MLSRQVKQLDLNNNKQMKEEVFARNEGGRIAYYRIHSLEGSRLWDNIWKNDHSDLGLFYRRYLNGYLGYGQLRHIFLKYLPRSGKILEAGCGRGQYVVALRARGYNCFGVDFADKTIAKAKSYLPDVPLVVGDMLRLNLKDESIDAYVSLGVMEHFLDGPQRAIEEAYRVLKKNGIMLVSVPQAFHWRRLNAHSENTPLPDNASFYQYAFPSEEFRKFLEESGFLITAEYGYSLSYAFRLRSKLFRKLLIYFPKLEWMDIILDRLQFGKDISRMLIYVAKKGSTSSA